MTKPPGSITLHIADEITELERHISMINAAVLSFATNGWSDEAVGGVLDALTVHRGRFSAVGKQVDKLLAHERRSDLKALAP